MISGNSVTARLRRLEHRRSFGAGRYRVDRLLARQWHGAERRRIARRLGEDPRSLVPIAVLGNFAYPCACGGVFAAIPADGTVATWGDEFLAYYGTFNEGFYESLVPLQAPSLTGVTAAAAGGYHTLAVRSNGRMLAWGNNVVGQVGIAGAYFEFRGRIVPSITDVVAVAAGVDHSLAVRSDGSLSTWGHNSNGQLGDGTTNNRIMPMRVEGWPESRAHRRESFTVSR
jgi:hypothetical protein